MSGLDRFAQMDAIPLVRMGAALSLILAGNPAFSYNFPLMLFGVVSFELTSTAPQQFFLTMVVFTGLFDFINLLGNGFTIRTIVAFIVMCLKVPIYMGGLTSLRNRGGEIAWGSQGFAPAAWMPAGMGGGAGQPLGSDSAPAHHDPSPPGAFGGGGYRLGGDSGGAPPPRTTRDGYTSIA
ncbi:hypothetical protein CC85DRAFT_283439 [Cutaneotrichosporon oleaginosum]|uniref:Uncharacterized protein n=1 Tax=Cutaneotrichosporon oleaginosum TaxID=879819 RepID=A0A0J0XTV9_9TREE|nr:uncharacterized protein CC85DRAFT_283439 [Cutaneotrichosporon oleaginosum]KLT44500.1 hypothetical protein CC85DRAFT_283439 [Cutaneotrichosporon oleaginosum]TXT13983.1 hypothetical protein COLE_00176 [Cutaneotrichosporon oleaginosum]